MQVAKRQPRPFCNQSRVFLQRLRRRHCVPWDVESLAIQRSLVRQALGRVGGAIATSLAQAWAQDMVNQWPQTYVCHELELRPWGLQCPHCVLHAWMLALRWDGAGRLRYVP